MKLAKSQNPCSAMQGSRLPVRRRRWAIDSAPPTGRTIGERCSGP
jgi:hypothetical protein